MWEHIIFKICYHFKKLPTEVRELTQREAFLLYKRLQYQEALEIYNKSMLAGLGKKEAERDYNKKVATLDLRYYEEEEMTISKSEIERIIIDAKRK